jgi:hypothetical protein
MTDAPKVSDNFSRAEEAVGQIAEAVRRISHQISGTPLETVLSKAEAEAPEPSTLSLTARSARLADELEKLAAFAGRALSGL